ncbi:MAG: carboxypeptidase-like regulatory domain-containing protein [Acidobacteriota bacterium]|nr:carboxypeptidase-like regulatory domain-containing protein [Acidobacteriota bacterium]
MSTSARSTLLLTVPCLFALYLPAQQTPYVVGSTVSGHVFCADTNAPARFAKVLLKSTAPSHAGEDMMKNITDSMTKATGKGAQPPKPQTDDQKRALAAASKGMDQFTDMLNSSTVGLDGSYSFVGVKPGTYYVHALYSGYIDPYSQFSDEDFASTDPAIRARIAQLPTVTVSGTDSAHAELRIERGAAVSGRILYDDGSPAVGWTLAVIKPKSIETLADAASAAMAPALAMMGLNQPAKTDDRGRFRISGLTPGDYALRASLTAPGTGISAANMGEAGSGISLAVYTGDTFTRADAKPLKLAAGDELTAADITVPSRKLHNIIGHVVSRDDGHTLNVGLVNLTVKDNPAINLKAAIRDDGSFHFEDLTPNLTYTLTVADAADGRNDGPANSIMGISMPNPEILHKYGTDTTTVLLTDTDVDSITLHVAQTDWKPPAKKPKPLNISPGDLVKGLLNSNSDDDPK